MRLWPRTLAVQLILVIAITVVLSNIAVGLWFDEINSRQNQIELVDRMVDRTASAAKLFSAVPPSTRRIAERTLGGGPWIFRVVPAGPDTTPMSEAERDIAERLRAQLPPELTRYPIYVHSGDMPQSGQREPQGQHRHVPATTMSVGLDENTRLKSIFRRFGGPPVPWEPLTAGLVAIIATSAAAAFIVRRMSRPLSALTAAAATTAKGGATPRVPEEGPADVRDAAIAFNKMTEQVTKTLESQRHLLSAVGHDLRTPITAMRINLEFLEDSDLREGLLRNLDELQEMTEQVLSAARGAGGEPPRNVDLSALLESLCTDMDEMGEPVSWVGHPPAPLSCRPNEIRRAVRNLVENAVAYGGRADVRLADTPKGYEILVEDDGPGIAEDDQHRVFEPFVRLESSRNAATGGTGLGLTLVKAIAEGHGGAVRLENRSEGGLRARLDLPRKA
jgi:signal transduction histidine kinase